MSSSILDPVHSLPLRLFHSHAAMAEAGIHQQPKSCRWSPGETAALVDAWAALHNRRRGGHTDAWVPHRRRGRAPAFRGLVFEDLRAVAVAVNAYRADAGLSPDRTLDQCKRRMSLVF